MWFQSPLHPSQLFSQLCELFYLFDFKISYLYGIHLQILPRFWFIRNHQWTLNQSEIHKLCTLLLSQHHIHIIRLAILYHRIEFYLRSLKKLVWCHLFGLQGCFWNGHLFHRLIYLLSFQVSKCLDMYFI